MGEPLGPVEVVRCDASQRAGFDALHCDAVAGGWCRCVAWWVPTWDGWSDRSASANAELREELWRRGEQDGYLLLEAGAPIAWCQAVERDRLPKLTSQLRLAPQPGTWGVTCFLVAPSQRRRGAARAILDGVLADLPARGARRVEAYPKRGDDLDDGDRWNGPEALFVQAGFAVARDDATRPVLARALDAPA